MSQGVLTAVCRIGRCLLLRDVSGMSILHPRTLLFLADVVFPLGVLARGAGQAHKAVFVGAALS